MKKIPARLTPFWIKAPVAYFLCSKDHFFLPISSKFQFYKRFLRQHLLSTKQADQNGLPERLPALPLLIGIQSLHVE